MTPATLPRWIFTFVAKKDAEPEPVPEDLTALSDDELASLESSLVERFDTLYDGGVKDPDSLATLGALREDIARIRAEKSTRETAQAEVQNEAQGHYAEVHPPDPEGAAAAPPPVEAQAATAETEAASEEPAVVEGEAVVSAKVPAESVLAAAGPRKINVPLSEVRRRAPEVLGRKPPVDVIVAAADIPGFTSGGVLPDLGAVAQAMQHRARSAGDSRGSFTEIPIASIQKEHPFNLNEDSTPEMVWDVITKATDPDVLAAAGGWCAPSEIRYELFNVTCEDGMVDLPTTGITRGGIRWPISPNLADVLGSLWIWTEQNDIDALATGGPTKPCAHVECVTFDELRLIYDGLCVTAGNLTERSYPELIRNFITLVMSAHFHTMNKRKIDTMVTGSTAVDVTVPATGAAANILASIDLQAIDYRMKFGMCLDDVLEVVLPDWVEGPIRADFSRRMGLSPQEATISDAVMRGWFDERQVRAQFVNDYQIRATGFPGNATAAVAWPATVNFLLYAAGTWLLGDGPTIDLGIIRDSTLNARNDHTAAWSEEGFLVAKVGHESRNVEVEICPDGTIGDNVAIGCPTA